MQDSERLAVRSFEGGVSAYRVFVLPQSVEEIADAVAARISAPSQEVVATVKALVEVAEWGVSHAESAERDADYGVPTFGPSDADRMSGMLEGLREPIADLYIALSGKRVHASDCATSNAPAGMPGPCDCALTKLGAA